MDRYRDTRSRLSMPGCREISRYIAAIKMDRRQRKPLYPILRCRPRREVSRLIAGEVWQEDALNAYGARAESARSRAQAAQRLAAICHLAYHGSGARLSQTGLGEKGNLPCTLLVVDEVQQFDREMRSGFSEGRLAAQRRVCVVGGNSNCAL